MRTALQITAATAFVLFALVELGLVIPVAWWLYLSVVVLFAIGILRFQPVRRQFGRIAVVLVIAAVCLALYLIPWTSRKPFLHDLYSIKPGMTEAEVRQIMGPYMEGTGWPAVYGGPQDGSGTLNDLGTGRSVATGSTSSGEMTIQGSLVFRHSTSGAFNSDWGIVTFKDGRVTGISFSPD